MVKTVAEILARSRGRIVAVHPDDNVLQALQRMATENQGAILVLEGRRLAGIFSEGDFARKVTLRQRPPHSTQVKEVMSIDVLNVSPQMSAEEALSFMNRKGVRHACVSDGEGVVGFLSILDVVDAVLADRDSLIQQLETYVSETWPI